MTRSILFALLGCLAAADVPSQAEDNPPASGFQLEASDPRAIEIADAVMHALGGRESWDRTRYVSWLFFGRRLHYWDKWSGDVRIEAGDQLVLMNIGTKEGRAWKHGSEVTHPDSLAAMLADGFAWWTNDSYWAFMPYKLKDTGVRLTYGGEKAMEDGRMADVLELTFANVGLTPQNKYEVYVDKESRLVCQWSYYTNASDTEPRFTMPWKDWRRVGGIMLCNDHGRDADWRLAVYDELPRTVFTSPDSVTVK